MTANIDTGTTGRRAESEQADPKRPDVAPERAGEAAGEPLSQTQRVATLIVMLVPLAGLIAAMALVWGWGFGTMELILMLVMYVVTGLGVTVGYHRLFTHRSFSTGPLMTAALGVMGSMAVEGPIIRWVAQHRRHHHKSDKAGDPHSPHGHGEGVRATLKGFLLAHMGWMLRPGNVDTPPPSPPSGPRSMIQSAHLMTSRLCSMTTTVLPMSARRLQHVQQVVDVGEVQAGGRLVEDVERVPGGPALPSSVASLTRWASPPESVVMAGRADVAQPDVAQRT
jgi:hypothetical protein